MLHCYTVTARLKLYSVLHNVLGTVQLYTEETFLVKSYLMWYLSRINKNI